MSSINFTKSLNSVRSPIKTNSFIVKFFFSSMAFLGGMAVEILSKFLEKTPVITFPFNLGSFNFGNFLGSFTVIALIGIIVSAYSRSYLRATLNTFLLYAGMLAGHYLYSIIFADIIPDIDYLTLWVVFTLIYPLLGVMCWYAKGKGIAAILLSAIIITFMFMQAFNVGLFYITFKSSILDLIVWIASIVILFRDFKQTLISVGISIPIAFIYSFLSTSIPYL